MCSASDMDGMDGHKRLLAALCACLLALVLPAAAGAAEIVDRSVASPTLSVNSRNVALVTYSVHGVKRHVLYWGAVDWANRFKPRLLGRLEEQGRRLQALQQQLQAVHGPAARLHGRRLRRARRLALGAPAVVAAVEELRRRPRPGRAVHLALARRHRPSSRSRPTTAITASTSISGAASRSTASPSSVRAGRSRACPPTSRAATSTWTSSRAPPGAASTAS